MSTSPSMAQVYIFEAETGLVKIGYTIDLKERVRRIQTSSGFKIKRQSVSPRCFNYREVEKNLHKQFAEYRRQGEWFAMDFQAAVEALNRQKFETNLSPSTQLVAFHFEQSEVRTFLDTDGNPCFIAKDVCDVVGIEWKGSHSLGPLDEDEKGTKKVCTLGGEQDLLYVNESGLYVLIFRSNKPIAKPFRRWVTHEVIPTIRKTGKYEVNPSLPAPTRRPEYQDFDAFVAECFVADSAGLVAARDIYAVYKGWCKRHQRTIYSHKLLGQYLKESGYVPTKRTHGKYFWLGMRLQKQKSLAGEISESQNCLTQDGESSKNEILVLLRLALEKLNNLS